ncbi:hypothetical protein BT69DRAFT_86092, partial [Atractiella rhizophila]
MPSRPSSPIIHSPSPPSSSPSASTAFSFSSRARPLSLDSSLLEPSEGFSEGGSGSGRRRKASGHRRNMSISPPTGSPLFVVQPQNQVLPHSPPPILPPPAVAPTSVVLPKREVDGLNKEVEVLKGELGTRNGEMSIPVSRDEINILDSKEEISLPKGESDLPKKREMDTLTRGTDGPKPDVNIHIPPLSALASAASVTVPVTGSPGIGAIWDPMRSPSPPPNFSTPPMPTSSSPILSRHPSLPALSMGIGISGHARRLSSEAHSATSVGSHSPRSPRGFVFGSSKKKNRARERSNSREGPREEDVEEVEGEERELRTRDSLEELGGGGGSGGGSPHTPSPHGRLFPPLPYAHDTAASTSSPSSSSPSHPSLTFLNNALVEVGTSGGSAGSGSGSGGYSPPFGLTSFSLPSVPLTSHHGHTTVTTSGSPTRSFHSAHLPPSSLSISTFATTRPPSPPVPIGATASPESPTLYFNKDALRTRDSLEIFDPMLLPPSAMEEREREGAADGERDRDTMDIVHEEMDAASLPYLLRGPDPALSMGEETVKDFHPPSTLHPPQPQPPSPMVAAFPPLSVDSLGLSMDESSLTGSGLEADEMFGWKKEDEMELTLLERIIVCGKSS